MVQPNIYKSVLGKLSELPLEYLTEVDKYLTQLNQKIKAVEKKVSKREQILAFSGAWNDMSEEDFSDFQESIQELRKDMFSKEIEL